MPSLKIKNPKYVTGGAEPEYLNLRPSISKQEILDILGPDGSSNSIEINDNGQAPDPKKKNTWIDLSEQESSEIPSFDVVEESNIPDIPMARMNGSWTPIITQDISDTPGKDKEAPSSAAISKIISSLATKSDIENINNKIGILNNELTKILEG